MLHANSITYSMALVSWKNTPKDNWTCYVYDGLYICCIAQQKWHGRIFHYKHTPGQGQELPIMSWVYNSYRSTKPVLWVRLTAVRCQQCWRVLGSTGTHPVKTTNGVNVQPVSCIKTLNIWLQGEGQGYLMMTHVTPSEGDPSVSIIKKHVHVFSMVEIWYSLDKQWSCRLVISPK